MDKQTLKLISWNVNGYRAVMKKDFLASMRSLDADIVGLQETKLQDDQLTRAMQMIKDAFIDNDIYGSDHCPVGLVIEI